MATAEVIQAKTKLVEANRVTGYRAGLDTPAGYVLKLGSPGGYGTSAKTRTPGAILKDHASGVREPYVPQRVKVVTTSPPNRLGIKGRSIVPHNGFSLGNINGT
jgi:hypothetical protein